MPLSGSGLVADQYAPTRFSASSTFWNCFDHVCVASRPRYQSPSIRSVRRSWLPTGKRGLLIMASTPSQIPGRWRELRLNRQADAVIGEISQLTINSTQGFIEVELLDGTIYRERHADLADPCFARTTYRVSSRTLEAVTASGSRLVFEIDDGSPMVDRFAGRTIVYLDQNKWIALAQFRHSPDKIPQAERKAVAEFTRLAESGEFILPFSTAHMMETGSTGGKWRSEVAPVIARLCRGWFMTDPLIMRRIELASVLCPGGQAETARSWEVFTLNGHYFDLGQAAGRSQASETPTALNELLSTLSLVEAIFGVLVEGAPTSSQLAKIAANGWARHHQNLAEVLRDDNARRSDSRSYSLEHFLRDLQPELRAAATACKIPDTELNAWSRSSAEQDIAQLPYLGLLRDVTHFRLRNAGDEWERNDLIDLNFLSCAAAYADQVIGEKHTIGLLQRASRTRTACAQLHRTFAGALEAIS